MACALRQSFRQLSRPHLWLLAMALWLLPGCATEPVTGRWMIRPVAEAEILPLGSQAYQEMLKETKLSSNATQNDLVRRVGERIARVTDARMAEEGRTAFQWDFKVIQDDKTINAWCLPGGKVAFYTGILPVCDSELGVAVVMGHEVAHAYAQHGGRRMAEQSLAGVTMQTIQTAFGGEGASQTAKLAVAALGVGYQLGVQLPFSRGDESAADHIGLILMAEAGFDPREAPRFWKRMMAATGGDGPPKWLSTHPPPVDRIENLEKLLPSAVEIYERSRSPQNKASKAASGPQVGASGRASDGTQPGGAQSEKA